MNYCLYRSSDNQRPFRERDPRIWWKERILHWLELLSFVKASSDLDHIVLPRNFSIVSNQDQTRVNFQKLKQITSIHKQISTFYEFSKEYFETRSSFSENLGLQFWAAMGVGFDTVGTCHLLPLRCGNNFDSKLGLVKAYILSPCGLTLRYYPFSLDMRRRLRDFVRLKRRKTNAKIGSFEKIV